MIPPRRALLLALAVAALARPEIGLAEPTWSARFPEIAARVADLDGRMTSTSATTRSTVLDELLAARPRDCTTHPQFLRALLDDADADLRGRAVELLAAYGVLLGPGELPESFIVQDTWVRPEVVATLVSGAGVTRDRRGMLLTFGLSGDPTTETRVRHLLGNGDGEVALAAAIALVRLDRRADGFAASHAVLERREGRASLRSRLLAAEVLARAGDARAIDTLVDAVVVTDARQPGPNATLAAAVLRDLTGVSWSDRASWRAYWEESGRARFVDGDGVFHDRCESQRLRRDAAPPPRPIAAAAWSERFPGIAARIPNLDRRLATADAADRLRVLTELSYFEPRDCFLYPPFLRALLDDPSARVRGEAVQRLAEHGILLAADELPETFETSYGVVVRSRAWRDRARDGMPFGLEGAQEIEASGLVGNRAAIDHAVELLGDANPYVRYSAAAALVRLGAWDRGRNALVALAANADHPFYRQSAGELLWRMGDEAGAEALFAEGLAPGASSSGARELLWDLTGEFFSSPAEWRAWWLRGGRTRFRRDDGRLRSRCGEPPPLPGTTPLR